MAPAAPARPVDILLVRDESGEVETYAAGSPASDLPAGDPLSEQLLADGYAVRIAHTATHARVLARGAPPDLVLIQVCGVLRATHDLIGEIRSGELSVAGADNGVVRENRSSPGGVRPPHRWPACVPVIVIGARSCRIEVLRAFEAGADDYLAAPVFYLELRARIRALLGRCRRDPAPSVVRAGPLTIDTASRTATLDGRRALALPRLQYELLLALAREPRRVIARSELIRDLWGGELPGCTRTLDSHASRLRRALCPAHPERWIVSVRGVGYRLR